MSTDKRILQAPDGSRTVRGQKLPALAVWGRLSNEAQRICGKWLQAAEKGQVPSRAQLMAGIAPEQLDSILIVDALPGLADYRYTFVGRREVAMRGDDPTGRTLRQCFDGEGLEFVLESYDMAVREKAPCVDLSIDVPQSGKAIETETVFLPLSEDGVSVVQVLVYSYYAGQQVSAIDKPGE